MQIGQWAYDAQGSKPMLPCRGRRTLVVGRGDSGHRTLVRGEGSGHRILVRGEGSGHRTLVRGEGTAVTGP